MKKIQAHNLLIMSEILFFVPEGDIEVGVSKVRTLLAKSRVEANEIRISTQLTSPKTTGVVEGSRAAEGIHIAIAEKSNAVLKIEAKLNLYPNVLDPRTGRNIPLPYIDGRVAPNLQVPWNGKTRVDFIKDWYVRGYDTPKGGWSVYDIHHIQPRAFGGTNDFWNLVPVERTSHQLLFNNFWRQFGSL